MVVPVPDVKMGIYLERHCAACRVTTRSLVRKLRLQPLPGQSLEDAIDASLTGGVRSSCLFRQVNRHEPSPWLY